MSWFYGPQGWILIGILFFGFLVYVRWRRRQELRWIEERFGGVKPLVMSFGVIFFGTEGQEEPARKKNGFLLLLPDRLFFRSRSGDEWEVPTRNIQGVDHDTMLKGRDLNQSVMIVEHLDTAGQPDRAAFRIPYPPQWMKAIRSRATETNPEKNDEDSSPQT